MVSFVQVHFLYLNPQQEIQQVCSETIWLSTMNAIQSHELDMIIQHGLNKKNKHKHKQDKENKDMVQLQEILISNEHGLKAIPLPTSGNASGNALDAIVWPDSEFEDLHDLYLFFKPHVGPLIESEKVVG